MRLQDPLPQNETFWGPISGQDWKFFYPAGAWAQKLLQFLGRRSSRCILQRNPAYPVYNLEIDLYPKMSKGTDAKTYKNQSLASHFRTKAPLWENSAIMSPKSKSWAPSVKRIVGPIIFFSFSSEASSAAMVCWMEGSSSS